MLIITKPKEGTPGVLCRVISDTPKRFYVEVLLTPKGAPDRWWVNSYVANLGRLQSNQYVNKEDALVLDVTEQQYSKYLALEARASDLAHAAQESYQAQLEAIELERKAGLLHLFGDVYEPQDG